MLSSYPTSSTRQMSATGTPAIFSFVTILNNGDLRLMGPFCPAKILSTLTTSSQVINKAGGLVYQRNFADGLAQLTSNEYLVLAGTLHGIHAITSRLSPVGSSSGAHVIEGETFKITIFLTTTGACPS
jgi:hypothetical protein